MRGIPGLLLVLATVLPVGVLVATAPAEAQVLAADVHGDDEQDKYVGTGGLILPGSVDSVTRRTVAQCPSCRWRLTAPCIRSDAGVPFSGQPVHQCEVRACGPDEQLLRAWFSSGDGAWRDLGPVCIGAGGPVTVSHVGEVVQDGFAKEVRRSHAQAQPARGVVAQLPVVFDSGQAGPPISAGYDVAGARVTLEATPAWSWEFGDGVIMSTTDPGGRYPHTVVSHAYRQAGRYRVRLTTMWSGTFTVDGLGPFAVDQPIRQDVEFAVQVGEGRAVLAVR